jgi:CRP/FNR family cyclic AMP-dependent transcriptional regulator
VAAEAHEAPATRWERLLDLDRDLAEALGEDVAARARDRIGVATVHVAEGSWSPQSVGPLMHDAFALLVCEGLIVRELDLAGTVTVDLLGPSDVMAFDQGTERLLATGERWHVSGHAVVAILDSRVLPALHAWPILASRLIARAASQAARAAEQRAISQLPRVELRIRALLWHLAERWGRMGPAGVVVPIDLTHTALGHLVGARRSTVTLALGELGRLGLITRRDDGAWVLRADSNPSGAGMRLADVPGIATITMSRQRERPAIVAVRRTLPPDGRALTERVERLRTESAREQARTLEVIERCRATCARLRERRLSSAPGPGAPPS